MKSIILALALLSTPAVAQTYNGNQILPAGKSVWIDPSPRGDMRVTVNLHTQMAYVYSDDTLVAETAVSTGRDGYETAPGHFTVLGKEQNHFSKHWKANMPWTMWFNTQGEALHAGGDPGAPSSHGCVHMPIAFAAKLYTMMKVGDSVDIVDDTQHFVLNL